MTARINSPHPQPGPTGFIGICVFGLFIVARDQGLVEVGTEAWWVGILILIVVLAGFTFIIGGWLWIQREVAFEERSVVVRRWFEILTRRPGHEIPLDARTTAAITLENVRSLQIRRDGKAAVGLTLGYWAPKQIRKLVDTIRARGIELEQYWDGPHAPGT